MTKVILYEEAIKDLDILKSSFKVPYLVRPDEKVEIPSFVNSLNVENIQHLAFLWMKSDYATVPEYFEEMLALIVDKNPTIVIDLLTCNITENYDKDYIAQLSKKYNLTIRYSVDLTGHPDSMGNWVLESHSVSIKDLYFNKTIDQWKHTLDTLSAFADWKMQVFYAFYAFADCVKEAYDANGDLVWDAENQNKWVGAGLAAYNNPDTRGLLYGSWGYPSAISAARETVHSVLFKDDITVIKDCAFGGMSNIGSIVIPNTVTLIGKRPAPHAGWASMGRVFYACDVTSITFESGSQLEVMTGDKLFSKSKISNIQIPPLLTEIHVRAFSECLDLTAVSFEPDSACEKIRYQAFYKCAGLTSIEIPRNVKEIHELAFGDCTALAEVIFENDSQCVVMAANSFANTAIQSVAQLDNIRNVPPALADYQDQAVLDMWSAAFDGVFTTAQIETWLRTGTSRASFSGAVATAWGAADADGNRPEVYNNLTGFSAGKGRNDVHTVVFKAGIVKIGPEAFLECGNLEKITIPNTVISIDTKVFKDCTQLDEVIFEDDSQCVTLGEDSFANTAIQSVAQLDNIRNMSPALITPTSATIAMWLAAFDGAFDNDQITNWLSVIVAAVSFRAAVATAWGAADTDGNRPVVYDNLNGFYTDKGRNDVHTVEFKADIEEIGPVAFAQCDNLGEITIPKKVIRMGRGVFEDCVNLKTANFEIVDMNTYPDSVRILPEAYNDPFYYNGPYFLFGPTENEYSDNATSYNQVINPGTGFRYPQIGMRRPDVEGLFSQGVSDKYSTQNGRTALQDGLHPSWGNGWRWRDYDDVGYPTEAEQVRVLGELAVEQGWDNTSYSTPENLATMVVKPQILNIGTSIRAYNFWGEGFNLKSGSDVILNNATNIIVDETGPTLVLEPDDAGGMKVRGVPTITNVEKVGTDPGDISVTFFGAESVNSRIAVYAFGTDLNNSPTAEKSVNEIGNDALEGTINFTMPSDGGYNIYLFKDQHGTADEFSILTKVSIDIKNSAIITFTPAPNFEFPVTNNYSITIGKIVYRFIVWQHPDMQIYNAAHDHRVAAYSLPYGQTFKNCTSLKSITIPKLCWCVGPETFYGCTSLEDVTFERGSRCEEIGQSAFAHCYKLSSIAGLDTQKVWLHILEYAFSNCISLSYIDLCACKNIDKKAFYNCINLSNVIKTSAVGGAALATATYPLVPPPGASNVRWTNHITSIGESAFENCTAIKQIAIPNTCSSIGTAAFEGCIQMSRISIPGSVTSIGNKAFKGCGAGLSWQGSNDLTGPVYDQNVSSNLYTPKNKWKWLPSGTHWTVLMDISVSAPGSGSGWDFYEKYHKFVEQRRIYLRDLQDSNDVDTGTKHQENKKSIRDRAHNVRSILGGVWANSLTLNLNEQFPFDKFINNGATMTKAYDTFMVDGNGLTNIIVDDVDGVYTIISISVDGAAAASVTINKSVQTISGVDSYRDVFQLKSGGGGGAYGGNPRPSTDVLWTAIQEVEKQSLPGSVGTEDQQSNSGIPKYMYIGYNDDVSENVYQSFAQASNDTISQVEIAGNLPIWLTRLRDGLNSVWVSNEQTRADYRYASAVKVAGGSRKWEVPTGNMWTPKLVGDQNATYTFTHGESFDISAWILAPWRNGSGPVGSLPDDKYNYFARKMTITHALDNNFSYNDQGDTITIDADGLVSTPQNQDVTITDYIKLDGVGTFVLKDNHTWAGWDVQAVEPDEDAAAALVGLLASMGFSGQLVAAMAPSVGLLVSIGLSAEEAANAVFVTGNNGVGPALDFLTPSRKTDIVNAYLPFGLYPDEAVPDERLGIDQSFDTVQILPPVTRPLIIWEGNASTPGQDMFRNILNSFFIFNNRPTYGAVEVDANGVWVDADGAGPAVGVSARTRVGSYTATDTGDYHLVEAQWKTTDNHPFPGYVTSSWLGITDHMGNVDNVGERGHLERDLLLFPDRMAAVKTNKANLIANWSNLKYYFSSINKLGGRWSYWHDPFFRSFSNINGATIRVYNNEEDAVSHLRGGKPNLRYVNDGDTFLSSWFKEHNLDGGLTQILINGATIEVNPSSNSKMLVVDDEGKVTSENNSNITFPVIMEESISIGTTTYELLDLGQVSARWFAAQAASYAVGHGDAGEAAYAAELLINPLAADGAWTKLLERIDELGDVDVELNSIAIILPDRAPLFLRHETMGLPKISPDAYLNNLGMVTYPNNSSALGMLDMTASSTGVPQMSRQPANTQKTHHQFVANWVDSGRPRLQECDLTNLNIFAGMNLSSLDFSGCNLSGSNFKGSNLTNVNLTNANLTECDMRDAIFEGTRTTGIIDSGIRTIKLNKSSIIYMNSLVDHHPDEISNALAAAEAAAIIQTTSGPVPYEFPGSEWMTPKLSEDTARTTAYDAAIAAGKTVTEADADAYTAALTSTGPFPSAARAVTAFKAKLVEELAEWDRVAREYFGERGLITKIKGTFVKYDPAKGHTIQYKPGAMNHWVTLPEPDPVYLDHGDEIEVGLFSGLDSSYVAAYAAAYAAAPATIDKIIVDAGSAFQTTFSLDADGKVVTDPVGQTISINESISIGSDIFPISVPDSELVAIRWGNIATGETYELSTSISSQQFTSILFSDQQYIKQGSCILAPGVNLTGGEASNCPLENVDCTGANLTGANFIGSYLKSAIFSDAILQGAKLDYTNLDSANFTNADLSEVDLSDVLGNLISLARFSSSSTLIVTAASAPPTSQSWIGVYDSQYANWDAAVPAGNAAADGGGGAGRGKYYEWKYVNGTGSGDPAAAGTTVTFDFSGMVSGTYNMVMFRDANEPDVVVSNTVRFVKTPDTNAITIVVNSAASLQNAIATDTNWTNTRLNGVNFAGTSIIAPNKYLFSTPAYFKNSPDGVTFWKDPITAGKSHFIGKGISSQNLCFSRAFEDQPASGLFDNVYFDGADLSGSDLSGPWSQAINNKNMFKGANLSDCNLEFMDFRGFNLSGTNMANANLKGVKIDATPDKPTIKELVSESWESYSKNFEPIGIIPRSLADGDKIISSWFDNLYSDHLKNVYIRVNISDNPITLVTDDLGKVTSAHNPGINFPIILNGPIDIEGQVFQIRVSNSDDIEAVKLFINDVIIERDEWGPAGNALRSLQAIASIFVGPPGPTRKEYKLRDATILNSANLSSTNLELDTESTVKSDNRLKQFSIGAHKQQYLPVGSADRDTPLITDEFQVIHKYDGTPVLEEVSSQTSRPWSLELYSSTDTGAPKPMVMDDFQFIYNLPDESGNSGVISNFTKDLLGSQYNKLFSSSDQRGLVIGTTGDEKVIVNATGSFPTIDEDVSTVNKIKNAAVFHNIQLLGSS